MNRNRRSAPTSIVCVVLGPRLAGSLFAATPSSKSADKSKDANASDNYDEQFARYLEAARRLPPTAGPDIGWVIGLAGDRRARHVNDLLTVQVIENITGTGSADSALTKDGKGAAAVTNAFGVEHKLPAWIDPANLVSGASKTDFKGTGATSRTGSLTATMTVRVAEVLPNGDWRSRARGRSRSATVTGKSSERRCACVRCDARQCGAFDTGRAIADSLFRQRADERQPETGLADSHHEQDLQGNGQQD